MADGLRDIIIKIIPSIDEKQYKKELQDLVDNSKSAMEKTYRNLDKSLQTSLKDVGPNVKFNNPWEEQIDNFLDKFREVQDYMQSTGFLPNDMNSKLYQAYANVKKLYDMYVSAEKEASKIYQDTATTTTEYSQWKSRLDSVNTSYTNMLTKIGSIKTAMSSAMEAEDLTKQLGLSDDKMVKRFGAEGLVKQFTELKDEIERARKEYEYLQNAVAESEDFWNTPDPQGLRAKGREAALERLKELQQDLNEAEGNYKGLQRKLNLYGKNREILEQIYQLTKETNYDDNGVRGVVELAKELERAEQKAETLKSELDSINSEEPTQYQYNVTEEYEKATARVRELKNELVAAAHKALEIGDNGKKAGHSFNQWRNVVWSISRLLGNIYTIGLDIARGAKTIANFYMRIWNAAKKVLAIFKKLRAGIKKTADDHAKSWKQMLKDVFRYSLGIRSLFMLFRRLRAYIKEAFTAMAEQIPEVNANLSELKSSFNALKGSLATALEPALAALIRSLVTIIDLLAKALTYVGMFIAALSGRGYVYQAQKVATSFADAAGSAEKLNKQLQGFDELNNLTTSKGGGGGADSPLAQFEKVDVPDWIQNLADTLKQAWETFLGPIKDAWAKIGDEVVKAWTRAFANVKNLLMDIARDFLKAWTSGLGESIATSFFKILRDIGNIVANIAEKIRDAWNAVEEGATKSNGLRFWEAILGIIDKILAGIQRITEDIADWTSKLNLTPMFEAMVHWLESLVPIAQMVMDILFNIWDRALKPILTWAFDGENSGIGRFFQILADFNNKLDKEKIVEDLNKIWDAIGRFGQNVGEGLLIFIERMADKLANWLNSDDFTQWCEDVAEFLDGLKPEDLADDLEQIVRIIQNIAKELWNTIQFVIDHKDQILDALEWASTHLKEIAGVFLGGKLAIDVARFAANIALAAGAFSKMFAGVEGGSTIFSIFAGILNGPVLVAIGAVTAAIGAMIFAYGGVEGAINKIKETVTNVFNNLKEKFNELGITEKIEKLKTAFANLKTTLQPVIDMLRTSLKFVLDVVFKRIEEIATFIGSEVLNVISAVITMLTGVIDFINGFVNVIKGAIEIIVGLFTGDLDKAREGAQKIWDGIKDIFKGSIEFVVGLFKGFVDLILEPFRQIKYQLIGDPIVIDMWDGIKKVFDESIGKVIEFVKNLKDKVIEFFTNMKDKVVEQIDNIKEKFTEWKENAKQIKDDVVTTLDDLKTKFVSIFDGIKEGIKTPINGIIGLVESLINNLITGFNGLGSKLGELSFETPDWLPGDLGGKKFELKIPEIKKISIPRLAQGAVIPPNKEFLAVLGDQKRGTNIESPLSTMVEAFNMANKGGNEQELALLQEQNDLLRQLLQKEFGISERQIFNSVVNQNSIYRKSTGISAFT